MSESVYGSKLELDPNTDLKFECRWLPFVPLLYLGAMCSDAYGLPGSVGGGANLMPGTELGLAMYKANAFTGANSNLICKMRFPYPIFTMYL